MKPEIEVIEEIQTTGKELQEAQKKLTEETGGIDQATKNFKNAMIFCLGMLGLGMGGLLGLKAGHSEAKKATDKCVKERIAVPENKDMDELAQSIRTCVEEELSGEHKTN